MPRVSVITRTRDRLVFLARSILSVQQQDFKDWEIIIVNDGGDWTALEELLSQVPKAVRQKISVIHHPASRGRWAAASAGISAARGELLVLHDDDDTWQERFLATMVAALDRQPASVGGVVCHTQYIDETVSGDVIARTAVRPFNQWLKSVTLFRMAARNFIPPISFLYRAELHDELGPYREELPVLGDWEFYLRLLGRYDVPVVPQTLANYHLRPAEAGERLGNSVAAGRGAHEETEARILNGLLRHDLAEGKLGLGAIANVAYDLRELREMGGGISSCLAHLLQARRADLLK